MGICRLQVAGQGYWTVLSIAEGGGGGGNITTKALSY